MRRTMHPSNRRKWSLLGALVLGTAVTLAQRAAAQPGPQAAEPGMAPTPAMAAGGPGMGPGPRVGAGQPGWGAPWAQLCGDGQGQFAHRGRSARMHRPRGGDFGMRLLAAAEKIGLSDAQKTQLQAIRRKSPSTLMPKRQTVMEARMDFQDLMAKNDASTVDIRKAHEKLQKAEQELRAAQFDLRLQAREVLTPEQREKLRQGLKERRGPGAGPGRLGMLDPEDFDDEGGEPVEGEF